MRASFWCIVCAWFAYAVARAEEARLQKLYAKLDQLERLDGASGEELRLQLVASVAANSPGLRANQLRLLLADLRRATADVAQPTVIDASDAPSLYVDEDDDWREQEYVDNADDVAVEFGAPAAIETATANRTAAEAVGAGETAEELEEELIGWDAEDEPGAGGAELRQAALQHWVRLQREAQCGQPTREAVCARDHHSRASAVFLPYCTLLHRCAPHTGCCSDPALVCAPLLQHLQIVYLPFYVLTVGATRNTEELLPFVNHTRCACTAPAAARAAHVAATAMLQQAVRGTPPDTTSESPLPADDTTASPAPHTTSAPHEDKCLCWPGWERAGTARECVCACSSRECASLARGREHFGLRARICVSRGECGTPRCEFGEYERAHGRCPRRRRYTSGSGTMLTRRTIVASPLIFS